MATHTEPLDIAYARSMKNHPYGTALYSPLPFHIFHPGSCGYFDNNGSWNPVADLSSPDLISSTPYSPVPETLSRAPPETVFQWGPKISSSTKAQKLSMEAGISATVAAALPADIGAWYNFSSVKEGGAVLLTKAPMRHERFYYESPFKGWVRENAAKLVKTRKEVLEYGLWIVTSTWSTQECAINVWNGAGKGLNVGFKTGIVEIGELAPAGEWWEDGRDGGWIKAKAVDSDDGRVVFFGGVRFQYRRIPFGEKLKSNTKAKFYRGDNEGGTGTETLVILDGQTSDNGEMFEVECKPVLETIAGAADVGEEAGENEDW